MAFSECHHERRGLAVFRVLCSRSWINVWKTCQQQTDVLGVALFDGTNQIDFYWILWRFWIVIWPVIKILFFVVAWEFWIVVSEGHIFPKITDMNVMFWIVLDHRGWL